MAEEDGTRPTMRSTGDGAAESQQYFRGQYTNPPPHVANGNHGHATGEPGQNFYPNANGYNNQYPKPEAPLPSRNF